MERLRTALGNPQPALLRIWQEPFDHDPAHLFRLVALGPDEEPSPSDLTNYCLDFQYEEVQQDLFRYALPLCLSAWRRDLLGETAEFAGVVAHLYPALHRSGTFERLLSPPEGLAVSDFFADSILDAIDAQHELRFRGSEATAYRWFTAFSTAGVILPAIGHLWSSWWDIGTVGRACAAIQYISCLVFDERENPVFVPRTPAEGGGPPSLWEFGGDLYENCWRPANVEFLRANLHIDALEGACVKAIARLKGKPEETVAELVRTRLRTDQNKVVCRCEELPDLLEKQQTLGCSFKWSW